MKALLNAKIKRRESFRPFAPSVLEEAVTEWFEEDDAVPFMMQVFQIREEKRSNSRSHPCGWLWSPPNGLGPG
jgi:carbamoyltransferase